MSKADASAKDCGRAHPASDSRKARLAMALRDNLRKRKEQARARAQSEADREENQSEEPSPSG